MAEMINVPDTRVKISFSTPGFKSLVTLGKKLPPHPHDFIEHTNCRYSRFFAYGNWVQNNAIYYGSDAFVLGLYPYSRLPTGNPDLSSLMQNVENALNRKLNSRPIDLGIAFRERGETAEFVANSISRTLNVLNALKGRRYGDAVNQLFRGKKSATFQYRDRRGKVRTARRPIKIPSIALEPAEAYMAISWGFQPLLSDVLGAFEKLEQERPERIKLSATLKSKGHDVYDMPGTDTQPSWSHEMWFNGQVRGTFSADVGNSFTNSLHSLGITNPVATIYKTLPLSFVLDWFLPIGSWLEGVIPVPGLVNESLCMSYSCVGGYNYTSHESPYIDAWHNPNPYASEGLETSSSTVRFKKRTLASRQPTYTLKPSSDPLTGGKLAGLIALLVGFSFK